MILKISKLGFNTYSEDAVIQYIRNLQPEYFDMFSENLVDGIDADNFTK